MEYIKAQPKYMNKVFDFSKTITYTYNYQKLNFLMNILTLKTTYLRYLPFCLIISLLVLPHSAVAVLVDTDPDTIIHETLVIPVYADDEYPKTSVGIIEERMKEVRDCYLENSYGSVTFHSHVVGWTKLPRNLSSYVIENGEDETPDIDTSIFTDAVNLVNPLVDFSKYDTLVIIHAGTSYQLSHPKGKYIPTSNVLVTLRADGKTIRSASIVSEEYSAPTICHELGHRLGASDLYDYESEHSSLGPWCLMSSGSSGFCGYTKEDLGYITDDEVFYLENRTHRITLSPLSSQFHGYRLIKYQLSDGRCMYIEARNNNLGSDSGLPSGGILIYIINETSIEQKRGENDVIMYRDNCSEAPLRKGESIGIGEFSISASFVEITYEGYVVDISTEISYVSQNSGSIAWNQNLFHH